MKITYVSHATMVVDAGGFKIATDPWWAGPAYAHQWNVFPRPVNANLVDEADVILISHAHQDHLHEPTLRSLKAGKSIYYPYYWYEGTPEWLAHMGFDPVVEAHSGRRYAIAPDCSVTFLVNGQDALMVLEADGQVLVNVNDALHSSDPATIDVFVRQLLARWPKIDAVFCGFGGASYFPNVFHAQGKDDDAIGRLREEFFAMNFCRIVAALRPAVAVPFAADFVLLDERQQWINGCRFPRENLGRMFDAHYRPDGCNTLIAPMYSGDVLESGTVTPLSPYRPQLLDGEMAHLIDAQYARVESAFVYDRLLPEDEAGALAVRLEMHIQEQIGLRRKSVSDELTFSIHLLDVAEPNWYVVREEGGCIHVSRSGSPDARSVALITTTSEPLNHSLTEDWGGDDLLIGYGCRVEAPSQADLPRARECAELLLKLPQPGVYLRRRPLRALRYIWQNREATVDKIKRKLAGIPGSNTVGGNFWLTDSPDAIRRRLNIPERSA